MKHKTLFIIGLILPLFGCCGYWDNGCNGCNDSIQSSLCSSCVINDSPNNPDCDLNGTCDNEIDP